MGAEGATSPVPDVVATVVVPAHQEAGDIAGCIAAIGAQSVGVERLQVLLVDGGSTDGTVAAAQAEARRHGIDLQVLANPERTAATSLNLGLREAVGPVVVRVDARSRIAPTHVEQCVAALADPQIGVVGGGQRAIARPGAGLVERSIARSQRNRYTTGLAAYRRAAEPQAVDTVWMGAFRAEDLRRLGGWPTWPAQNQDYRLNQRFREDGLLVWFDPGLTAGYLPRRTWGELARQYRRFGQAKAAVWRSGERPAPRQLVLLAVPVVGSVGGLVAVRRWGIAPVAGGLLVAGLAVEHLGVREPAPLAERAAALVSAVVADASWLVGVAKR